MVIAIPKRCTKSWQRRGDKMDELSVQALESAKSAHKRLDLLAGEVQDIHQLAAEMASLSANVDHLSEDIRGLKTEMQKVTGRSAQWWDKLIAAIIGAIGAGLVSILLSQITN
jgi:outer membrane murein-binding lipoprotein Lpp